MDDNFNTRLGRSIRAARKALGLSAHDIARLSDGAITPVALSTYERGTRTISVVRLAELSEILRVPLDSLVPRADSAPPQGAVVRINIRRLFDLDDRQLGPLVRWARTVAPVTGKASGEILTLRTDQLEHIAVLGDTTLPKLLEKLLACGVLTPGPEDAPAFVRQRVGVDC